MSPNRTTLAVLATFCAYALPAAADTELPTVKVTAETTAPATVTSYQAPVSSSATKIKAPLRDVPQTVNVVTQRLIEDQAAHSLQDVLRNVPGVSFNNGDGQRDQVLIRGFSALGDLFLDGIRDDAMYYRDLSNIEHVDVVKGPAAVLYGRGSSGGVINRISKKPNGQRIREVTLSGGSFDHKRAQFDIGDRLDDTASFRVTGTKEDGGSFREQGFIEREALSPSLRFALNSDTTLLLQADYLKDRRLTDMGMPAIDGRPVDMPIETYYGSADARKDDYNQSIVTSARATLEHRINDNWSLREQFGLYRYELDRHNTFAQKINGSGSTATASMFRGDVQRQDDGWFNQLELNHKTSTGPVQHQLLYGIEVGEQKKDLLNRGLADAATVSLYNPVLVRPNLNTTLTASNLTTLKVSSAYVQDLLTLSPQWKALLGVRYDEFEQRVEDRMPGKPSLRRVDREWSPRAGVVFQPDDWQSYYLSHSRSFQPSGEVLAFAANIADIAPEETSNIELGAKFDLFDGRSSLTAAVFELTRRGVKETEPVSKVIVPVGEQRTRGLELALNGELATGWQLAAGYAYLDAEITKSVATSGGIALQGKRMALTPRHSANLWLKHELGGGFALAGGANYASNRYASNDNTISLGSYVVYDAALSYKAKAFDVAFNVKNLGDKRYFVSGHGSSNNLNQPGAPRSYELTTRLRF